MSKPTERLFVLAAAALFLAALAGCQPSKPAPASPAGQPAPTPPAAAQEVPVSTVLVDRPGLLLARLANGMDVLLAERHAAPVATVQVWVKCGSVTEDTLPGSGVSHFVEHMLFKGTARRKVREMDREIANAGGADNAYTTLERTVYHVTLPSRNFDVALDCLADAVQHAAFDPAECERERQVILKEINLGEDDAGRVLDRYLRETIYRVSPRRHPVIGYRPNFERITRDQLVGYWRRMYAPNNIIFAAAGDFDAKAVLKKVQGAFAAFERRSFVPPAVADEPEQASPRELRVRDGHFRDARLILSWPTVSIADPAMYPLDMAAALLGGGRTSRLHKRLVEQDKLVYSVDAGNYTPEVTGNFSVYANLDEKNLDKVLAVVQEEIAKLVAGPIEPAEMSRVVSRHRAREVFERETVDGLASGLAHDYLLTGDVDFSARYLDRLAGVKAEDVAAALKAYLVPERRSLVVVLPEKPGAKPPAGTAAAPAESREPKVEHVELPGGGKLLLLERHDDPIVAVSAVFLGGVRLEPAGKNGVSDLMASMLTRGTARHTAEQLAEILEACGGTLSGSGGRNSFGVSGKFLSGDLALGLGLVAEVIATPAFPEDEFAKLRTRVLAGIRRRAEDIEEEHYLLQSQTLYAPHPYALPAAGSEETVKALTRGDLVAFHGRFCRPDNMVLCAAGDFSPAEVKKLVLQQFGDFLKPRAEKLSLPAVPAVPAIAGEKRQVAEKADAKQALLSLGFRGADVRSPDRFALDVMRGVLSGMGGRLFASLRDQKSLAYSVGCYLESGLDPGAVVFYIATEKDKLAAARQGIQEEIDRIKNQLVPPEEFERTTNAIIGHQALREQRLASLAQTLAYNELYGLGAEATFAYIRNIEKLTAADVQRVARRYLTSDNFVLVITQPPGASPK